MKKEILDVILLSDVNDACFAGSELKSKSRVFQQLRPLCSQLLQSKNDNKLLSKGLQELCSVLATADPRGLKGCKDYVLFPLVMLIDAAVALRKKGKIVNGRQGCRRPILY